MGHFILSLTDEEICGLIEQKHYNALNLKTNEYAVVTRLDGEVAYKLRWTGDRYVNVVPKKFQNEFSGAIKARNVQQEFALDLLQNKDIPIKVLTGVQGAGKDFLMSALAYDQVIKGKKERIVFIRNNIEVRNTKEIGHLPGEMVNKMIPWAGMMADHLGGVDEVMDMVNDNKIEIIPLCHLRGRDLKDCIVYVTEAENLTTDHMKLIMGRCSSNSELWINGSIEQVDKEIFKTDSGLTTLINKLSGQKEFGHVHMEKTERGRIAELGELL